MTLSTRVILFSMMVAQISGSMTIRLDKTEDLFRSWKLEGDYLYYPNGALLETISSKLPKDFKFDSYLSTLGIWAILPTGDTNVHVNGTTTNMITNASFSYSSSAQLFASVSVKYNLRGRGAKIFVRTSENGKDVYEIYSDPERPLYEWMNINVPFDGSSKFFINVQVNGTGDYVLIDRIEGFYLESTTSTLRPKTSTPTPKPLPYNSANRISLNIFLLVAYNLLFSFVMSVTNWSNSGIGLPIFSI